MKKRLNLKLDLDLNSIIIGNSVDLSFVGWELTNYNYDKKL